VSQSRIAACTGPFNSTICRNRGRRRAGERRARANLSTGDCMVGVFLVARVLPASSMLSAFRSRI
jgi:hypothetical protein